MGAVFYLIPSTKLIPLKALAEQLGITIVLIHHLRKAADNDPFNMISGSTGLNGCVDGLLVLLKNKPYKRTEIGCVHRTERQSGKHSDNNQKARVGETERQNMKALNETAVEFEKKCKQGYVADSRQTFAEQDIHSP